MSIVLHIERLVLDEALLNGERAGAVRTAIERELAQRLAQPGAIGALRSIGTVETLPSATLPAPAHPRERLGTRIATAMHQGLSIGHGGRRTS